MTTVNQKPLLLLCRCASAAAAPENGRGIVGVAPRAKIAAIKTGDAQVRHLCRFAEHSVLDCNRLYSCDYACAASQKGIQSCGFICFALARATARWTSLQKVNAYLALGAAGILFPGGYGVRIHARGQQRHARDQQQLLHRPLAVQLQERLQAERHLCRRQPVGSSVHKRHGCLSEHLQLYPAQQRCSKFAHSALPTAAWETAWPAVQHLGTIRWAVQQMDTRPTQSHLLRAARCSMH